MSCLPFYFEERMESEKKKGYLLDNTVSDLCEYLHVPKLKNHIIRIHTKKLRQLGELSFPLNIKNWHNVIDHHNEDLSTIFEYASLKEFPNLPKSSTDVFMSNLKYESKKWTLLVDNFKIDKDNVHLHLEKHTAFKKTITNCLCMSQKYGAVENHSKFSFNIHNLEESPCDLEKMNLTHLRLIILTKVAQNLTEFKLDNSSCTRNIAIELGTKLNKDNYILVGNVINGDGMKDSTTSAAELYRKRSTDMRLMAEHKYGMRVKSSESWNEYFRKLGEASITIEMLQNKPHKNVKVTMNNLSSANKGASFIFYNCARLSALFKEFEKKVDNGIYPKLIPLHNVDFSLLNQPEEWELLYVYIMQYPLMISSCVQDVEKGIVNPHYLISFLSNMCSIFSIYYRRIRILVAPKPHLIPTMNARIYLLKSLEQIFHKTLELLDINPIKEM